jgi:AraC-like DNA-binding protein
MDVGYAEWAPPRALRGVVSCLWAKVTPDGVPQADLVLPDGCSDLIWERGTGVIVAGPDTSAVPGLAAPGVIFGVRFWPWAGGPALGLPLSELRDQRIDLARLRPGDAKRLPGTLTPGLALAGLTDLAGRLVADGELDSTIAYATNLLRDPQARVEQVADEVGISMRQLRRRCDAAVGYGPKVLQRVLRFQRFVRRIDAGHTDLASLAAEAGYADQAHLTRECVQLAGVTPTALAKLRRGTHEGPAHAGGALREPARLPVPA